MCHKHTTVAAAAVAMVKERPQTHKSWDMSYMHCNSITTLFIDSIKTSRSKSSAHVLATAMAAAAVAVNLIETYHEIPYLISTL